MSSGDIDSIIGREEWIARQSAAGREADRVWLKVLQSMTPSKRLEKAFQLSEEVRQVTLAGIRSRYPDDSEEEVRQRLVDQLLAVHGTSLAEICRKQKEERDQ